MGNWRSVQVEGRVNASEATEMVQRLTVDLMKIPLEEYEDARYDTLFPLTFNAVKPSLCGLTQWVYPDGRIAGIGNLAERDYGLDDVRQALTMLAKEFPTLDMKLHAGGDWEDKKCVATFTVKDRTVTQGEPEIEEVGEVSEADMMNRLMQNLRMW